MKQRPTVLMEPEAAWSALSRSGSFSRRTALKFASLGTAATLAPVLTGGGQVLAATQPSDDTGTLHLPFYPYGQPVQFDPHRAPNWGPFWAISPYLWSGLLGFDERGGVVLDLAVSFDANDTADVWTATIPNNLTFENGEPVTAQSFIDSWTRALDPYQPAPMSTYLHLVEGAKARLAGEPADLGFTAVDDQTIEIRLAAPFSSFPAYAATFGWALVDVASIDDEAASQLQVPGIGPWQVADIVDGQTFSFAPNPVSPVEVSPDVTTITWHMYDGPNAMERALGDFEAGSLAIADVPASLVAQVTENDSLASLLVEIGDPSSTLALGMNFNQPPFDDLRYREAVAAAIDRDQWAASLEVPGFVAATAVVPPAVQATANYTPATPIAFDAQHAKDLLDDAGYDPEGDGPDIIYHQAGTDDAADIAQVAALLAMIQENSGLVIQHDTSLSTEQIAALQADNGGRQIDLVWWWSDSDTPSMLGQIGRSDSPAMAGWFNWSPELQGVDGQDPGAASEAFDAAISMANETTNADERNDAFRQAEQTLLDNAVYIPIGHWVQRYVQQPWLTGTRQGSWTGSVPLAIDAEVSVTSAESE